MPRLLFLDIILLIFGAVLLFKNQLEQINFSILRKSIIIVFLLYFLVTAFSLFFATNPKEGIFDCIKTFSILVLIVFFTDSFANTPDWAGKISKMMMVAATVAVAVGYYQYLTLVVSSKTIYLPDGREIIYSVKGLMAHKNQFSDYLMMLLPFLAYGTFRFKRQMRVVSVILIVLILFLIVLLQTRSVWAGILIMSFLGVSLILFFYKQLLLSTKLRNTLAITCLAIILAGTGILIFGGRQNNNSYLKKLRSITDPHAGNNIFRLKVWGSTLEMIKDHPITGVGAGNWQLEISKYLPDLNFTQKEMNWGRPHNDYLWVLSEKGIVGFLLYLSIFCISFFYAFQILRGKGKKNQNTIALLATCGLAGYMVVSFFTFTYERIDHQVYLAIFISAIASIHHRQNPVQPLKMNKLVFYIPVLIILMCGVIFSYATVKQEIHIKNAHYYLKAGKWEETIIEGKKVKNGFRNIEPEGMPVDWIIGQAYANSGNDRKAIEYFKLALQEHPYNFVVLNNLGRSYLLLGDLQMAKSSFETALKYLPNFTESLVNLASVEYNLGNKQKAYDLLVKTNESERTPEIRQNINIIKDELNQAARK
jgi:O-antigen ligase